MAPNPLFGLSQVSTPLVVVWLCGVIWLVLGSVELVKPARTARVTGAIAALLDTIVLLNTSLATGLTLLALTAIGLMVLGEGKNDRAISGLGIVGVLTAATDGATRVTSTSEGSTIPILVTAICLVGLVAAILVIRTATRDGSTPRTETPPIPPPPTNSV